MYKFCSSYWFYNWLLDSPINILGGLLMEMWNRNIFGKIFIVSAIAFFPLAYLVTHAMFYGEIDKLNGLSVFLLIDFLGILVGAWGADA